MKENTICVFKLDVPNFKMRQFLSLYCTQNLVKNLCTGFGLNILVILCPCVAKPDSKLTFTELYKNPNNMSCEKLSLGKSTTFHFLRKASNINSNSKIGLIVLCTLCINFSHKRCLPLGSDVLIWISPKAILISQSTLLQIEHPAVQYLYTKHQMKNGNLNIQII